LECRGRLEVQGDQSATNPQRLPHQRAGVPTTSASPLSCEWPALQTPPSGIMYRVCNPSALHQCRVTCRAPTKCPPCSSPVATRRVRGGSGTANNVLSVYPPSVNGVLWTLFWVSRPIEMRQEYNSPDKTQQKSFPFQTRKVIMPLANSFICRR